VYLNDTELRVFIYEFIFARGRPPKASEIAERFSISEDDAKGLLRATKIGKTLLVDDAAGEIWMAGPFASQPSGHEVRGARLTWWANCAWDALAIGILAAENVTIRSSNCGTGGSRAITIVSPPQSPPESDAVVHFLVPARQWYDDIGYT
jgi:hypothetical protein